MFLLGFMPKNGNFYRLARCLPWPSEDDDASSNYNAASLFLSRSLSFFVIIFTDFCSFHFAKF